MKGMSDVKLRQAIVQLLGDLTEGLARVLDLLRDLEVFGAWQHRTGSDVSDNQERPSARIMRVPRLVPLRASLFQPRVQLAPERNTGGTRLSLFRLGVWARFHTELRVRIFRSMPDTTGRARFGGIRGSHPRTK